MSKFSDYINNNEYKESSIDKNKNDYQNMIDKYSKLSGNELMQEFIKLTAREKKEGRLTDKELNGITNTIKPYLNDEQLNNLDSLINMVKDV